jgi:type IX secretion system PorP/SprF family membrane protein
MKKFAITAAFGLALLVSKPGMGQDLHFSQFFNSPLTTNPANTGFMPDSDYRLGAHYRNQWSSLLRNPYKTVSIFGDAQLFRNRFENGWLGVGGVLLNDQVGAGSLTSTKIYGSVAYHQLIGNGSLLSAGFNIGWANKRINTSKFFFPDQWNGKEGFEVPLPTKVVFDKTNINYFDLQAGLNYAYFPDDNTYINAGVSVHHINTPQESFFNRSFDSSGNTNKIPRRYIGFLNGSFKLNEDWIVNPNAYFTTQAKSSELVLGLNANYNLSHDGEIQLFGGVYYRAGDAFIPLVGLQWKDLRITFTYDATTSSLSRFNGGRGASEFSILKMGEYNTPGPRDFRCPTFKQ